MNIATATGLKSVVASLALAGAALAPMTAQARGHWGFDFDLAFPIALAVGAVAATLPPDAGYVYYGGSRYWVHRGVWYRPYGPRWVVVAPPPVYAVPVAQAVEVPPSPYAAAAPVVQTRPDPVIYPRAGQDAHRTEADRQECNRWAASQPAALADSAVFMRATEACLDGRGYTVK